MKREVINDLTSQSVQQGGVLKPEDYSVPVQPCTSIRGVLSELENHHKREPLARGMLRETLREKVFTHCHPSCLWQ